jgi:hypothetical protein
MATVEAGVYKNLSVKDFTLDVKIKLLSNYRYDLTYVWYENGIIANHENVEEHVFDSKYVKLHCEGEIVAGNSMVDQMINHLIMCDSELEKHSGLSSASDYRCRILNCIKLFWD